MRGRLSGALLGILLLAGAVACSAGGCPTVEAPEPGGEQALLLDPASPAFQVTAPDTFFVRFATTKGDIVIESVRSHAPHGADRFYNLVRHGFYDGTAFYRVVPGFVAQFGASPYPTVQRAWDAAPIPDDSVVASNVRGALTFAKPGTPDSRTTQLFINYGDNVQLDDLGFAPIGRVVGRMGALLRLYSGYGELPPAGNAPNYGCMLEGGDAYLRERYPQLDRIESATVIERPGVRSGARAPSNMADGSARDRAPWAFEGARGRRPLESDRATGVY